MSTLSVDTIQGQTTAANVKMPAGHILQTLQGGRTTFFVTSSSTYADVVSQTITPKYSSSKILITVSGCGSAQNNNALYFKLLRGSTEINAGTGGGYYNVAGAITSDNSSSGFDVKGFSIVFLDSPATTSATTYKLQAAAVNGTARVGGRQSNTDIAVPTRITVMEISV